MITAGFNYICDDVDYSNNPNALRVGCLLHARMHAHTCMYAHAHTHTYTHACTHAHTHTESHAHMYTMNVIIYTVF